MFVNLCIKGVTKLKFNLIIDAIKFNLFNIYIYGLRSNFNFKMDLFCGSHNNIFNFKEICSV